LLLLTVEQRIYLDCPPPLAFAAFTSPAAVLSWWGDDQTYRTREWESDLRTGGHWRARFETAEGQSFGASGKYLVVESPNLLEWTWQADWENVPKRLRMEFQSSGAGTQLRASSETNYNPEMRAEDERGLAEILGWFEQYCRSAK